MRNEDRKLKLIYHYSNYWHTWSRILYKGPKGTIELNLTPVNGFGSKPDQIDTVRLEVIRLHGTAVDVKDKVTDELPRDVESVMLKCLEVGLINRLWTFDYMSTMTPEDVLESQRYTNGCGAPYALILQLHNDETPKFHHWK